MRSLIRREESKVAAGGYGATGAYCRPTGVGGYEAATAAFCIFLSHGYRSGRLRSSATAALRAGTGSG
jgi:hypothetical protein